MVNILVILTFVKITLSDFTVQLLHTNDLHSRFKPVDRYMGTCKNSSSPSCFGGFPRLNSVVNELKESAAVEGVPTLFLNAGDTFQGTPYYTQFKWRIVAEMLDILHIDAMSLGNHELDDGLPGLAPFVSHVKVPIVCCNLNVSLVPELQSPNLTPSKILIVNGTKVGVIGYLTPGSISGRRPNRIPNLSINDEIQSVRAEARELLKKNVKILIGLGHSGYDKDLEIAKEVEEIDVIVGAHTHTFLYSGVPPDTEKPVGPYPTIVTQRSGKQVPVVQAYFGTKYLGYLKLNFDNDGNLKYFNGAPILLRGNFSQDPRVLEVLEPYDKNITITVGKVIGYSHVFLDNKDSKCRMTECNIGNMITDAFVEYMSQHCQSKTVAIGLTSAGSIRSSIDTVSTGRNGSITMQDVMTVIPWGKPVVMLVIPGHVLLDVLEHAVSRYLNTSVSHVNEFLQVSGLRVIYNIGRKVGKRVIDVQVLCADCTIPWFKTLVLEKTYEVVVPEYVAIGGDGFSMLANYSAECVSEHADNVIVAKYITAHSPINPYIEGRTVIINTKYDNIILLSAYGLFILVVFTFIWICALFGSKKSVRYSLL